MEPMTQAGFAPFALVNSSTRYGSSQTISVAVHLVILVALGALLARHVGPVSPLRPVALEGPAAGILRYMRPAPVGTREPGLGIRGGGGEEEELAARKG